MRFYHSVAIKIKKDDLLEVLGLNQIVKIFPWENESKTLYVKVCIKWLNTLFLDVRRTDVLLIACKTKGNKAHGS